MTQLDCNVSSCMYNDDNCCCKSKIEVEGSTAMECHQTCCGSFDKKSDGMYSNKMEKSSPKSTDIDCKATNCMFNESGYCKADHIGIMGGAKASTSDMTECGSFKVQ